MQNKRPEDGAIAFEAIAFALSKDGFFVCCLCLNDGKFVKAACRDPITGKPRAYVYDPVDNQYYEIVKPMCAKHLALWWSAPATELPWEVGDIRKSAGPKKRDPALIFTFPGWRSSEEKRGR